MLIIPELHAVFIFPPRTGSDTLCVELMRAHPNAFLPYRHMEADGLPVGYDSWRRVGFVRHPLARLWSLFKYCSILSDQECVAELAPQVRRVVESVAGKSFEQWLVKNEEPFLPLDSGIPLLTQLHPKAETRKSQWEYLRPDLGTVILKFQDLPTHMAAWGLDATKRNGHTPQPEVPKVGKRAMKHLRHHFAWDFDQDCAVL